MLPSTRKLRVGLALSPELIAEADKYARSWGISRLGFFEEAIWLYLERLDKYIRADAKIQSHNKEALAA
ncbi:hypothetical protein QUA41_28140 [Microcoleus sp. Pol11C1]|uniref:hypothetical protein n=1 Tax=unclassified Microcoleus TaxID=2642155 RepID=UPI002FCEC5D4